MNLPHNKEETDRILFELLEGNLSKEEQQFWYDYSLKNNEFAKQLALFRKIYLHEDLTSYPDHSHLIRKTSRFAFWKNPFLIAGLMTVLGIAAYYAFSSKTTTQAPHQTVPNPQEKTEVKKETIVPISSEESTKKAEPAKATPQEKVVSQPDKPMQPNTNKTETVIPREANDPKPEPVEQEKVVMPSIVRDSVKAEKAVPAENKEDKEAPAPNLAAPAQKVATGEEKHNKTNGLKLKVKPSKKTKTSDFNY